MIRTPGEEGTLQVPAPFAYERAQSVEHAIELLTRLGSESRLIAGGHSLLPMMKLRLATPEYLIDINDLEDELSYIERDGADVRIGALTRHRDLLESDLLADAFPIFRDAERVIADPVVRNRGSLGGSLCQADPSEDLSAVCATLDAVCVLRGPAGTRVVSMTDFYRGPYETELGEGEMLIEVRVATGRRAGSAYHKVDARAGAWAIASAGAAVWLDGDRIGHGRVGLAAVGTHTTSIDDAADCLSGAEPSEDLYARVGAIAADASSPVTDQRGTEDYKRHLAAELTRRSLRVAVARAAARRD